MILGTVPEKKQSLVRYQSYETLLTRSRYSITAIGKLDPIHNTITPINHKPIYYTINEYELPNKHNNTPTMRAVY